MKNPKPVKLNSITDKLDMKSIKGGEFNMGAAFTGNKFTKRSNFPIGSSSPEHKVTVSDFSASRFEIAVEQWRAVQEWAKSNGYSDLPEGSLGKSSSEDLRHPVVDITWFDVLKWCNAVSEKQNLNPCYTIDGNIFKAGIPDDENVICDWNANGYRLPTEAEWEYAEQAGSDACWYWGDDMGYKYCWQGGKFYGNTKVSHPVGQKYGNRFGLYDTIGNVWEWCWDIKTPHTMNLNTPINPKGAESKQALKDYLAGINKKGKEETCIGGIKLYKGNRTLKGGAYNTQFGYHNYLCSQFRVSCSPGKSDDAIGFRVVRGK